MARAITDTQIEKAREPGYPNNLEYLSDEMKRLDLIIRIKLLDEQKPSGPLDQFKGLVLSDEEISNMLLTDSIRLETETDNYYDDAESEALAQAVYQLESRIEQRRSLSLEEGIYLPLAHLSHIFRLTRFEESILLACLAPELHRKYEKLYAYMQDDVTRRKPSVDLLLNLHTKNTEEKIAARQEFDPRAPMLRFRLLQMSDSPGDGPSTLLARSVKLDDRIANFLLELPQMDAKLDGLARFVPPIQEDAKQNEPEEETLGRALNFIRSHINTPNASRQRLLFYIHGPYGAGTRQIAHAICRNLELPLIVADVRRMLSGPMAFEEAMLLIGREAVLHPAAVCLENIDSLIVEADKRVSELKSLIEMTETFSHLTILLGRRAWKPHQLLNEQSFISIELSVPDDRARRLLWEDEAGASLGENIDFGALASKFRLTPGQIRDAWNSAQTLARWRSPDDSSVIMGDLDSACRAESSPKIGTLAIKVNPRYYWDDIVLPPDQMAQVREICNQALLRHIVYGEWGFDRKLTLGKGLSALFSGPPGTGKTMAAEVLANELNLDLYKIDLSQVVSKYIGETEKNLHHIFEEARSSGAILFFDEADALFGKRSEVKDAHDRYANIEVGYLLQKMEEYDGIAVLATNLRQNLDEAFVRRMYFIVEFPFPDEEYRKRIWNVIFPREAPLSDDLDFGLLAREIKLSGGNIKNIALAAAFYAASEGETIRMHHVVYAARREFQKIGRTWNQFEEYRRA